MADASAAQSRCFDVSVTDDGMRALVQLREVEDLAAVEQADVVSALEDAKVQVTESVTARVDELIAQIQSGSAPAEPFVVAEGSEPEEGQDARVEWSDGLSPERGSGENAVGRVNYYERHSILTVEEGAVLGQFVPAVPARAGLDVRGNAVPSRRKLQEVVFGENVQLADDGSQRILATAAGRIVYRKFHLSVSCVLQIEGDIDFETGNIDSAIDVEIRGGVQDLFTVQSRKGIDIGGHVGAATLKADGDIVVLGGIGGKEKGTVRAGGTLTAKFCGEVHIESGGDIVIEKETINSEIVTDGVFRSTRGAVIGGWVHARQGMEVGTLGSDAGIKTRVSVGTDPRVRKQLVEIEAQLRRRGEAAEKAQAMVAPLMAALDRLTAGQREQATGLIQKAESIRDEVSALEQEKQMLLDQIRPSESSVVEVVREVWPGTTVIVDGLATTFKEGIRGHFSVARHRMGDTNRCELAMTDKTSGSVSPLASFRFRL